MQNRMGQMKQFGLFRFLDYLVTCYGAQPELKVDPKGINFFISPQGYLCIRARISKFQLWSCMVNVRTKSLWATHRNIFSVLCVRVAILQLSCPAEGLKCNTKSCYLSFLLQIQQAINHKPTKCFYSFFQLGNSNK